MLSHPLPVFALVSRYLTNWLMGRRPLLKHRSFPYYFDLVRSSGISKCFHSLSPS